MNLNYKGQQERLHPLEAFYSTLTRNDLEEFSFCLYPQWSRKGIQTRLSDTEQKAKDDDAAKEFFLYKKEFLLGKKKNATM